MNLSRKKSYRHESVNRILELAALYGTQKAFLQKCEIKNHSYISDLKHGKIENPSPDYLEKIIQGTGCSGTWLLTGHGEMFSGNSGNSQSVAEDPAIYGSFSHALALIERIEQTPDAIKDIPLPEGIEIRLAELLVILLKRHGES